MHPQRGVICGSGWYRDGEFILTSWSAATGPEHGRPRPRAQEAGTETDKNKNKVTLSRALKVHPGFLPTSRSQGPQFPSPLGPLHCPASITVSTESQGHRETLHWLGSTHCLHPWRLEGAQYVNSISGHADLLLLRGSCRSSIPGLARALGRISQGSGTVAGQHICNPYSGWVVGLGGAKR